MQLPENHGTRKLVFKGKFNLQVPEPYVEGHKLTGPEANVLNQTFLENIRNNTAKALAAAIEKAGGEDEVKPAALQSIIDAYVPDYEFGKRVGGGGARLDPVEREIRRIAVGKIKELLSAKSISIKDVGGMTKVNKLADEYTEKHRTTLEKMAKQRVKEEQALAADAIDI